MKKALLFFCILTAGFAVAIPVPVSSQAPFKHSRLAMKAAVWSAGFALDAKAVVFVLRI
jgi:hypothetical protein